MAFMPHERPIRLRQQLEEETFQARRATRQAIGAALFLALVTIGVRLI